jgi:proliferating cell nuclear antigen
MNFTIADHEKAELFTSIFKDIKSFTNEFNIAFEPERMYIQSMDSSNVLLFEIVLPRSWFTTYVLKEGSVTIGMCSVILHRILKSREKNQSIAMEYDSDDCLSVLFESRVKGEFVKQFNVPLMDISSDIFNIPSMENNVEILMDSSLFEKLIGQLKEFSDTLELECNEETMVWTAKNSDTEKMSVIIKNEDLESFSIDEGLTVKHSFSLKYLQNICKYSKISKFVKINIILEHPIQIIYPLSLGEDAVEQIIFYLAPKITDDE